MSSPSSPSSLTKNLLSWTDLINYKSFYCASTCKNKHICLGEHDRNSPLRRVPIVIDNNKCILQYSPDYCIDYKNHNKCDKKEKCKMSHTKAESLFHPSIYLQEKCSIDHTNSETYRCPFYHNEDEKKYGNEIKAICEAKTVNKSEDSENNHNNINNNENNHNESCQNTDNNDNNDNNDDNDDTIIDDFIIDGNGNNEKVDNMDIDSDNNDNNDNNKTETLDNNVKITITTPENTSLSTPTRALSPSNKEIKQLSLNDSTNSLDESIKGDKYPKATFKDIKKFSLTDINDFFSQINKDIESKTNRIQTATDEIGFFFHRKLINIERELSIAELNVLYDCLMKLYIACKEDYLTVSKLIRVLKASFYFPLFNKFTSHQQAMIKCGYLQSLRIKTGKTTFNTEHNTNELEELVKTKYHIKQAEAFKPFSKTSRRSTSRSRENRDPRETSSSISRDPRENRDPRKNRHSSDNNRSSKPKYDYSKGISTFIPIIKNMGTSNNNNSSWVTEDNSSSSWNAQPSNETATNSWGTEDTNNSKQITDSNAWTTQESNDTSSTWATQNDTNNTPDTTAWSTEDRTKETTTDSNAWTTQDSNDNSSTWATEGESNNTQDTSDSWVTQDYSKNNSIRTKDNNTRNNSDKRDNTPSKEPMSNNRYHDTSYTKQKSNRNDSYRNNSITAQYDDRDDKRDDRYLDRRDDRYSDRRDDRYLDRRDDRYSERRDNRFTDRYNDRQPSPSVLHKRPRSPSLEIREPIKRTRYSEPPHYNNNIQNIHPTDINQLQALLTTFKELTATTQQTQPLKPGQSLQAVNLDKTIYTDIVNLMGENIQLANDLTAFTTQFRAQIQRQTVNINRLLSKLEQRAEMTQATPTQISERASALFNK